MSVWSRARAWWSPPPVKRDAAFDALAEVVRRREGVAPAGGVRVTQDSALRQSAVWAALRLRANLISSLPVDGYRRVAGVQVDAPLSPFFDEPAGPGTFLDEWLWATQFDLDRYGVTLGAITQRDGNGLPRTIELMSAGKVRIRGTGWRIEEVRHGKDLYSGERLADIYIEHQYRPAGFAVGLCPIAYAAWSIGGYLSAQKFGLDYFGTGAFPAGVLKNTAHDVPPASAGRIHDAFMDAIKDRGVPVVGKDWEWQPEDAPKAAAAFLEEKRASDVEVARYLDVPADMIDGAISGSAITYANITQRNVQLLVTSLGPAVARRERRLSRLLAQPRFVKLNSDAFLRMDPQTRASLLNEAIAARRLAPSETRALDDLQPFTDAQLAEFDRLFGAPAGASVPVAAVASAPGPEDQGASA